MKNNWKKVGINLLKGCLAAHLGCFFGNQIFYVAFNTPETVLTHYINNPDVLFELLNFRITEYTIEFALCFCTAPLMIYAWIGSAIACVACIHLRRWNWLLFAILMSFAALTFIPRLAWKV